MALYPLAALLVIVPLADPVARTWPLRLGEAGWRFGTFGLLFNSLVTPLVGLTLAMGAALGLDQRRTLRVLAVVAGLTGLGVVVALAAFGLDAIELRHNVAPTAMTAFQTTVIKAALAAMLGAAVLLGLTIGAWRTGRKASGSHGPRVDRLVMHPSDAS